MSSRPALPAEGEILFSPGSEQVRRSRLSAFMEFLAASRGLNFSDYQELWTWSVQDLEGFWTSVVEHLGVSLSRPPDRVLSSTTMPGAKWFLGATLNYAEQALQRTDDQIAVVAYTENGETEQVSYSNLRARVARAQTGLRKLGLKKGDRVAALSCNTVETLVMFLATASLGAVWSSCAPEFGVGSVVDRFSQIQPKLLFCVAEYRYGGKSFSLVSNVRELCDKLPSVETVVAAGEAPQGGVASKRVLSYDTLLAQDGELQFEAVPFEHPLWVLYSSGTTGLPKPIVQGHGGIVLEHKKALALHCDLGPGDRFFWFSTTGWMMYNFLIGGLLVGCTIVLYDGSPAYPDINRLWQLCDEAKLSYFGASAPYLMACRKEGLTPGATQNLASLRAVGTTGAPLPIEGFVWVYAAVGSEIFLGSVSGGTDVCTAFVLSCPILPVRAGEIQCAGLGCDVKAFGPDGNSVVGQVGELVVTRPMPSMPIGFYGDTSGERYRESYFSVFEGVWRHGDWIKVTESGGFVIYGRSDSTLNRGGVRMGTSEFYRVVDQLPFVADSLVVDTSSLGSSGELWLFVVLEPGVALSAELQSGIKGHLRREISPRHVPDHIRQVRAVPRTLNGKKLEVPIKRLVLGATVAEVLNLDTLSDPSALDDFREFFAEA